MFVLEIMQNIYKTHARTHTNLGE